MTVQKICGRHGRYIGRRCPTCKSEEARRPKPSTQAERVRSTKRWKVVQKQARIRDGERCTYGLEPGDRGTRHYPEGRCPVVDGLQGHHRVPIEAGGAPYELTNVRTLCSTHHAREEAVYRSERRSA